MFNKMGIIMKNNKIFYCTIASCFIIITAIFVYKYVKNESPIYIYDYSGYYETYKGFSKEFLSSKSKYIKEVISSVRNSDYNCTPIVLLLPFYIIFKTSRMGYILGCCLFYVIPTLLLTIIYTKKIILKNENENNENIIFTIFLCIFAFLYTRWWSPTLRGLPDIIAVIPLIVASLIVLKYSFLQKHKAYIPVVMGFLMYLSFLFRRYFIYSIIGFYSSLFIRELIRFFAIPKNEKKKAFFNALKNFLIAGLTTLILVLLVQLPLVRTILAQDYSESYSAFQDTITNHVNRTIDEFGFVVLFFVVIGIVYTIKTKKYRENGLFCMLNIGVTYGTFATVQAMGVHHYLTISFWIFVLYVYGIYCIYNLLKQNIFKIFWCAIITIYMIINFCTTYIYRDLRIPIISQNNKYCKFYYDNFNELQRLIGDLDKILDGKNSKFAVFASSEVISDNLLDMIGTDNLKKSVEYSSAIDLRDGMSFNSLLSEYAIVTNIPQTGTSDDGQRVVSVPNNEILKGTSIGNAYEKISDAYILENNVEAYIYKKIRGFTEEEIQEYMNIFFEYYPQWNEKYSALDYAILMAERSLGEEIGNAKRYKNNSIYMSPGFSPTEITIKPNKKIESMKLRLYIDENGVDITTDDYGKIKLTIKQDEKIIYEKNVLYKEPQDIELELSNTNNLEFIVDKDGKLSWDNLYMEIKDVRLK